MPNNTFPIAEIIDYCVAFHVIFQKNETSDNYLKNEVHIHIK